MKKAEITYLIFNIPFCLGMVIIFYFGTMALEYRLGWYPSSTLVLIMFFSLVFIIDLVILAAFHMLRQKTIIITILELGLFYLAMHLITGGEF
jgi:hypothetical protein